MLSGEPAHMPSQKRLNGLAHNILDHAVSGLSYLQPHLAQVCRTAGVSSVTLDLLAASPLPSALGSLRPAVLACETLHQTFLSVVQKLGFTPRDIASATLTYEFPANSADDYRFACTSELVGASGRIYRHSMHTDTYYSGGLIRCSSEQTAVLGPHWLPSPSSP
jgi:hypothetical protein